MMIQQCLKFKQQLRITITIMGQSSNSGMTCGIGDKDVDRGEGKYTNKLSGEVNTNGTSRAFSSQVTKYTKLSKNKKVKQAKAQHENIVRISNNNFTPSMYNSELMGYEEVVGKKLVDIILQKNQTNNQTSKQFSQEQLLSLLESLVYALAFLDKKNIPHHNFYPTTIFFCPISPEKYLFKIANPQNLQSSAYSLTLARKRFSFLSPQLILAALKDQPQEQIDHETMIKSDIFAIGMILMQCGSMLPSAQCYDSENYHLIDDNIKMRINIVADRYKNGVGEKFADCLERMLEYHVDRRIGISQLAILVNFQIKTYRQRLTTQAQAILSGVRTQLKPSIPMHRNVEMLPPGMIPIIHPPQEMHHQIPIHQNHFQVFANQIPPTHFQPINLTQYQLPNSHIRPQTKSYPSPEKQRQTVNIKAKNMDQLDTRKPMRPFQQMDEVEGPKDIRIANQQSNKKEQQIGSNIKYENQQMNPNQNKESSGFETYKPRQFRSDVKRGYSIQSKQKKDESLEERVERILRMSKDIQ